MTTCRQAVHKLFTTTFVMNTYQQEKELFSADNKLAKTLSTTQKGFSPYGIRGPAYL